MTVVEILVATRQCDAATCSQARADACGPGPGYIPLAKHIAVTHFESILSIIQLTSYDARNAVLFSNFASEWLPVFTEFCFLRRLCFVLVAARLARCRTQLSVILKHFAALSKPVVASRTIASTFVSHYPTFLRIGTLFVFPTTLINSFLSVSDLISCFLSAGACFRTLTLCEVFTLTQKVSLGPVYTWLTTHKEHNRRQHALHGNG